MLSIKQFSVTALSLLALLQGKAQEKPNIILFLVDDMGWSDLGCYASDDFHETPCIDRLAAEGIKFTNGYAACSVSSPTRASIMTGQYPARLHLTDWIPGILSSNKDFICPKIYYELPTDRITVAQALKERGYRTVHIGKWHLGENENYWPEHYGFDVNVGGHRMGAPGSFFFPYAKMNDRTDWTVLNLPDGLKDGDYLTDVLTEQALKEIDHAVETHQPFFLNMAYYQVHTPLEGKPEYVEKYRNKWNNGHYAGTKNLDYAAMIQSLDESVDRILQRLKELHIERETFIILTSDNGGVKSKGFNGNAPLRGGKGSYYEGGIREPYIICWPGKVPENKVSDQVVISTDIYATILDVAGASCPDNQVMDGISLLPYVTGKKECLERKEDAIYWHYPHFHDGGEPVSAVRRGNYKLIEFQLTGHVELYDVVHDLSETCDLAKVLPQKVDELQTLLHVWKKEVKADDVVRRTAETEKLFRMGDPRKGANNIKNPPLFVRTADNKIRIDLYTEGEVHYTLDGTEPTRHSLRYIAPLDLKEGGEIKAKVWSVYDGKEIVSETATCNVTVPGVSVSSVSSENRYYPSTHILDTVPGTYWESEGDVLPQSVTFDLGTSRVLGGFTYQPARRTFFGVIHYRTMPDNRQGAITDYRIEAGDTPDRMVVVKEGCFKYIRYAFLEKKTVHFERPVSGRYIRFTALGAVDGKKTVNIENMEFIPFYNSKTKQ